jgi:hypothetical protein
MHPFWLWAMQTWGLNFIAGQPVLGIPITAMVAFVLSALSAALFAAVPGISRTVT